MASESFGTRRERQIRELAANLGVADFVYSAPQVRKGGGNREPSGDGLLIAGDRGAVLQVKTRDPALASNDTPERGLAWIKKNAAKAKAQGLGSKRELLRLQGLGSPLKVIPVRAQHLPAEQREKYALLVESDTTSWPTIVVVDHPLSPEVDLGFSPNTLWLTAEDWHQLHRRIRSTSGLLDYVARCFADKVHVPLGHEIDRYSVLRKADVRVAKAHNSSPVLPDIDDFDELGAALFHEVIDRVWPDDGPLPWNEPKEYRAIVEFLDKIPPVIQSQAGQWFLRKRKEIAAGAHKATGAIRLNHRDRLVFGCAQFHHWQDEHWRAEFTMLTALRHAQALETGAPLDTVTLGIGALVGSPFAATGVAHTFALLKGREGALPIPPDLRRSMEHTYGRHEHASGARRSAPNPGRNDPCPCMSGRKFKKCCGCSNKGT